MPNKFNDYHKLENIFSEPIPPTPYDMLQALKKRKNLSGEDARWMKNLETGINGERQFYALIQENLSVSRPPIYNLQLEANGSECQIDCLFIFRDMLHLAEVKNFRGDYIARDNDWIRVKTTEPVKNPLHQVSRAELVLKAWLKTNRITLPVSSHLIFMNPHFYLYEASVSMPIVFPSQHHAYLKKLRSNAPPLNNQHDQLASKLKASHIFQSRHAYTPKYSYEELQKGIFCPRCSLALPKPKHNYFQCQRCGHRELIGEALWQAIKEFQLLIPDVPINVTRMITWTGGVLSKNTIRRCLMKHFTQQGKGRGTYYV